MLPNGYIASGVNGAVYDEDFGQYTTLEQFMRALCDTVSSPQRYHDTGTDVRLSSVAESTLGKAGNTDWGALGNVLVEVVGVLRHPIICAKTLRLFSKGYAQKAHYPLLCLSWLDSLEGNWKWYEEYVKVFVNCPVNVIVYNENNNIAAQIIDGSVNESYDELVAYVDDDGQKVIVIPQNAEYMIQMDAYDSGNVTYTLEECGIENSMPERLVSFSDISVTTGETLTGIVPKKELDSSARYQLLSGDGGLTPDVDLTGADIRTYQVTVSAMGNGVVNGGGSYTVGEFSKVSATSNKGSAFEGWYINDQFVSQEMEYRMHLIPGCLICIQRCHHIFRAVRSYHIRHAVGCRSGKLVTLPDRLIHHKVVNDKICDRCCYDHSDQKQQGDPRQYGCSYLLFHSK